jgi:uncharacterized repeat protein (TIGR03806 family)
MTLKTQQIALPNIRVISILCLVGFFLVNCKDKSSNYKDVSQKGVVGLLQSNYSEKAPNIGLEKLSDYGFFKQPLHQLIPVNKNVVPYELNSPLFTDYASKKRYIVLPEKTKILYKELGVLDFPKGTVLVKNFYYKGSILEKEDKDIIIETRLLIKDTITGKWQALPYLWNESQTEAYLYIFGKDLEVGIKRNEALNSKLNFTYSVPNTNMCKNCHVKGKSIVPLGPSASQLNRINSTLKNNQLEYLLVNNQLKGVESIKDIPKLPDYRDENSGTINERARAYLEVNCAHCHQKEGSAKTSGLHLSYQIKDEYTLGVNKPPVAAGKGSGNLAYDIVKGAPEKSILLYRMKHLEPDVVMPEIGKNTLHKEGISLIEKWISSMEY